MNSLTAGEIITGRHLSHQPTINSIWSAFVTVQENSERERKGRKEGDVRKRGGGLVTGKDGNREMMNRESR